MAKKNSEPKKLPAPFAPDFLAEGDALIDDAQAGEGKGTESVKKGIVSLAFWLGLILFIKFFVADIYIIPSGSMEPTLHGRENNGDRIFCTKANYWWRAPQRWEVFVFKYPWEQIPGGDRSPYKGENFIKRCVGLPGEEIAIRRGDIYVRRAGGTAERQVKSRSVQEGVWIPVYTENFDRLSLEELGVFWKAEGWTIVDGQLISTGEHAVLNFIPQTRFGPLSGVPDRYLRRQYVSYVCPVGGCGGKLRKTAETPMLTARCPRCGKYLTEGDITFYDFRCEYPAEYRPMIARSFEVGEQERLRDPWHFVPDLRLRSKVRVEKGGQLEMQLFDDQHVVAARLGEGGVSILADGRALPVSGTPKLEAGRWYEVEFYRLDGTVQLWLDGARVADLSPFAAEVIDTEPRATGVDVVAKGTVALDSLRIDRDIYYYVNNGSPYFVNSYFPLPRNGYMALGDNQPSSEDSRVWGIVPEQNLVGTAQFTWWPVDAWRTLSLGQ